MNYLTFVFFLSINSSIVGMHSFQKLKGIHILKKDNTGLIKSAMTGNLLTEVNKNEDDMKMDGTGKQVNNRDMTP